MNLLQIRREMPSCRCPLYTAQSQRMYRVQTSSNFSFGLECVESAAVLVAYKDGNEVGGRRPKERMWYLDYARILCARSSELHQHDNKVVCCLGCQLRLLPNSWHSWTSDGSRWAYCMLLHAEVACVVSEHSGGAAFSDRNVLWVQQQLGIWKGTGWSLMGLLYQCKQNLQVNLFLGIDACFVFRDESDESSFSLQTKGQRTKPAKHFPCASILRWVVPFLYVVSGTSDHFKKVKRVLSCKSRVFSCLPPRIVKSQLLIKSCSEVLLLCCPRLAFSNTSFAPRSQI